MKKIFNTLLVLFTAGTLASSVYASTLVDKKHGIHGNTLFQFVFTTSDNDDFNAQTSWTDYIGTSATAPCSDLKPTETYEGTIWWGPGIEGWEARDIMEVFGPGVTCFRSDIKIDGKSYTTGNVLLKWNAAKGMYVSAFPFQVNMNLEHKSE